MGLHLALAARDKVALLALEVLSLHLVHVVHVLLHVVLPDGLVVAELAVVHPGVHLGNQMGGISVRNGQIPYWEIQRPIAPSWCSLAI